MLKTTLPLLLLALLLLAACVPSAPPVRATPNLTFVYTVIAQTQYAVPTLTPRTIPGIPITGQGTPTPLVMTATPLASLPSPNLSPTPPALSSSTPTAPAASVSTSTITQVSVTTATNCRLGPGQVYEKVGGLDVGETAEVVGRDVTSTYWIIKNPDRPGELCWLWGTYANVKGNTGALRVYLAPPTPVVTPSSIAGASVTAVYQGLQSCTGVGWWAELNVQNTSELTFESMSMALLDTTHNQTLYTLYETFTNRKGCNGTDTYSNLPPGATFLISSPTLPVDPTGRALRADLTLCTSPGQNGTCVTKVVDFTP